MPKTIDIGGRLIGEDQPVYIIAEMSANHAGDINNAFEIVRAAKAAGANCLKIQTYTADTMTIDCHNEYFNIKSGKWIGENLYELYKKAYTPWEWQKEIKSLCEELEIDFLSTPFDKTAVDFLETLNVQAYKIASFEVVDIPLIKYIASKGKPIIMSTGMAAIGEIDEAVKAIHSMGNNQIVLLKCSSAYPAITSDMNLKTIKHLGETYNVSAGLSDHSLGSLGAVAAVAVGAKVIEKHFCISRSIDNPDASFSMEPHEFKSMVDDIRAVELALGKIDYSLSKNEESSKALRKSIFVVEDIQKGELFTEKNIRVIRPGDGLEPKYYEEVIGKEASLDIKRGEPLEWKYIK